MSDEEKKVPAILKVSSDDEGKPNAPLSPDEQLNRAMEEAAQSVEKRTGNTENEEVIEEELEVDEPEKEARLSALENELAEIKDKYLRTLADFQNYRQRTLRDRQDAIEQAKKEVLTAILAVNDNFDRAFESQGEPASVLEGVKIIYKHLQDVLKGFGVRVMNDNGEMFDPLKHEAVEQKASADHAPGSIIKTIVKRYMINDKLLRVAKVVVAKKPAEAKEAEKQTEGNKEDNDKDGNNIVNL